jgi:hypothetical protein
LRRAEGDDLDRLTGGDAPGGGRRMRAILLLAGSVLFVVSPLFTQGFGGFDPTLFPVPQERPPVQPAGYAFSIWGLIYLALVAHAGFGLLRRAEDRAWDAPRWPLTFSVGIGAAWISVAQASAVWATVLIWLMLAGAMAAAFLAPANRGGAGRWLGAVPIGIYAGWLTAASWVSVGLMLGGYGVLGAQAAALVALAGAIAFAAAVQVALARPAYGLTVAWALVGVVVANTVCTGRSEPSQLVAALAALGAGAIVVLALRRR